VAARLLHAWPPLAAHWFMRHREEKAGRQWDVARFRVSSSFFLF